MEEESLRKKTITGLIWNAVENFASLGIQFIVGIILARLLSPSEFGIIGMTAVFLAVSEAFVTSGFGSALIRKQNRTEVDNSTVFYFNIVVAILFYLLLFLAAPYIAVFYGTPILSPVIRVLGLTLITGSLAIVQNAIISIRIDFKMSAKISVIAGVLSGASGITLAYMGHGVWALVVQMLINSAARSFFLWIMTKWRPTERFTMESFRKLFGYGSKLLGSGLLNALYNNIYTVLIGKLFSAATLGLYTRASTFANLPSSNLTNILQRVTFPILSQIQDDNSRLENNYRRLIKMSAFIIFPCMMVLFGVADPMVRFLLTDKWEGCIILLQIMCFSMMWYPIHALNLNLLQVKGRSDWFLKLEIIKKVIGVIILLVSAYWGVVGLCVGGVVSSLISLVVNTYYTNKLIGIGVTKQMRDIYPVFISSTAGGFAILIVCNLSLLPSLANFIIGGCLYLIYFFCVSKFFHKEELKELLVLLKISKR